MSCLNISLEKHPMDSSRKKSCNQCRVAKTRCSLDAPTCSRCQKKSVPCQYSHSNRAANTSPVVQSSMFNSWLASMNSEDGNSLINSSNHEVFPLSDSWDPENLEFQHRSPLVDGALRSQPMEWIGQSRISAENLADVAEITMPPMPSGPERNTDEEDVCWMEHPIGASANGNRTAGIQRIPITTNDMDLAPSISAMKHISKLVRESWQILGDVPDETPIRRRVPTTISSMVIGNHLWATIESYAVAIAGKSLPPFIHGSCTVDSRSKDPDFANLPEPLGNCLNITPMYFQKTPACQNLVFKTLILEIQRLYDEFPTYDERMLMHALQALTIYVIVIAGDKDRCRNISAFVGVAMRALCIKANEEGRVHSGGMTSNFPTWEDWIQDESLRRTFILLHIMNMLLDMSLGRSPTASCTALDGIPLPCSKATWEADTRKVWENEYKNYLSSRKRSKMLKCGDLRTLNEEDVENCRNDIVEDLSTWSKGVDDFGALLIMALGFK